MIHLNKHVLEVLKNDAFHSFPDECCGFMLGTESGEERAIKHIIVVNNCKEGDKRRRFEISPADYLNAERYADENHLQLLGVYHSHPNHPSVPSEQDRIAAQPYFSYLILAIKENELVSVQSWKLNEEFQFEEEKVLILKSIQA